MSGGRVTVQGSLGLGGAVFGARPRVRVVKLAVCGLFVMGDYGSGWFPVCASSDGLTVARDLVLGEYPDAVISLVSEAEVGK